MPVVFLTNEDKSELEKKIAETAELAESSGIKKFYTNNLGESYVADSDDGYMRNVVFRGKSEQFQTTGKNLLPSINNTVNNGITYTVNEDGGITVSGTATSNSNLFFAYQEALPFPAGEYIISGMTDNNNFYFAAYDGQDNSGSRLPDVKASGEHKVVLTSGFIYKPRLVVLNGTTVDNVTVYPMIRRADITDSAFEPYTGGKASPSHEYPQEIKSVENFEAKVMGNQLFDMNRPIDKSANASCQIDQGVIKVVDELTEKPDPVVPVYHWVEWELDISELKDCTHLTISVNKVTKLGSCSPLVELASYSDDGESKLASVGVNTSGGSATLSLEGASRVCVLAYATCNTSYVANYCTYEGIMVNVGTEPMPWQPYTAPQTITVPYTLRGLKSSKDWMYTYVDKDGQYWYGDEIDFDRGVFVQRINKVTLVGNETYGYYKNEKLPNGVESILTVQLPLRADGTSMRNGSFCDKAINCNNITSQYYHGNFGIALGGGNAMFSIEGLPTGDNSSEYREFAKAWFAEHPTTLVYPLITPIEIPLSKAELEAYRALMTRRGGTNIYLSSDGDLLPYIDFDYPCAIDSFVEHIKTQMGDTRTFIYDMDSRLTDEEYLAAMAYVNSEYAAALLELEV